MADQIVLSEMTWSEVDEVLSARPAVAIVPVGTTEAHGPHLPLSVECIIAAEVAKRGATKLKEHGVKSLVLPTVTYSVAERAADFAGTISISPESLTVLLRDVAIAASKKFRAVAFANLHLEPANVDAIKKAVSEATAAGASTCYVDITRKRWADMLGDQFDPDEHGGAIESSLMLAVDPERVRERERISLPPVEEAGPALKKGAKTLLEAGAEDAYTGDPTAASREDGENMLDALAEILSLSVMEHLGSKA
jgi:creatinine amidohydrolase/Fe(II)-dependent formamide hydrolase-like protein